jgi:hypothetical protein
MLYMLLICYKPAAPRETTGHTRQPEHAKLEAELRQRGIYVSGAGLWPIEQSKSISHRDGKTVVTDGPFAETKEAVGGYFIVDCDEEEALEVASRISVDDRSWIEMRAIGLFHPNVDRMRELDGYVDPRLRGLMSR